MLYSGKFPLRAFIFSFCIVHMELSLGPKFEGKGEGQILLLGALTWRGVGGVLGVVVVLCTDIPAQQAPNCQVP